jgi:SAM-dependent methyltransferase
LPNEWEPCCPKGSGGWPIRTEGARGIEGNDLGSAHHFRPRTRARAPAARGEVGGVELSGGPRGRGSVRSPGGGALAASGKVGTIIAVDRSPAALHGGAAAEGTRLVVAADEEALPFRDASLDLVVSVLAFQFVNDLPGTLIQIRRALKPDGLLLAALVGGDTLIELRQAFAAAEVEIEDGVSPRVAPFADVRDMGALLQRAGFALPVADVDRMTARYSSPFELMHDLRRMGATNPLVERSRRPLKRATLRRMAEIYAERFSDPDGRIRATFEVVWLSGWVPHDSQQKPLAPGSARQRLADVLGTRETKLPRDRDQ